MGLLNMRSCLIWRSGCLFFYWQDVFLSDKKNLAFISSRDKG